MNPWHWIRDWYRQRREDAARERRIRELARAGRFWLKRGHDKREAFRCFEAMRREAAQRSPRAQQRAARGFEP